MAGLTRAQRAEKALRLSAEVAEAIEAIPAAPVLTLVRHVAQSVPSLVLMHKTGEDDLEVHPTCVVAHEKRGWKRKS